jgi:hypothetical protein
MSQKVDTGIRHTKPSDWKGKSKSRAKVRSAKRRAQKTLRNAMYLQSNSPEIKVAGIPKTMSKPGWSGLDARYRDIFLGLLAEGVHWFVTLPLPGIETSPQ